MSPLSASALRNSLIKKTEPKPKPGPFAPPHLPPGEFRGARLGGKVTPPTPELDRMHQITDQSQPIGEFIEWLKESGFVLAKWSDDPRVQHAVRCPECLESYYDESGNDVLVPENILTERLLALYFDIDLYKCEDERAMILNHIREVQGIA